MAKYSDKKEWNTQDYAAARRDFCKQHGISKKDFDRAPMYLLDDMGGAGGREKQYVETDGNITAGGTKSVIAAIAVGVGLTAAGQPLLALGAGVAIMLVGLFAER